jgi:phosphoribosylformylglycinamidine synthase
MRPTGGDPAADDAILTLLQEPTIASKRWVFQQYDSTVRASTTIGPGGDAGVINVPGTRLGIALATDGNARYVKLDPFEGGKAVVAEAARNVAVTGARPIGITNCLNFGNPERPAVFFEFREACRGISAACAALGTPVTGGNVSFYNESPRGAIDPTPVIGMVGLLEDVSHVVRHHFQQEGDTILLIGSTMGHMGGSTYWRVIHDTFGGPPPPVDLPAEKTLIEVLVQGAQAALLRSAHDLSDGGLAIGLVESCIGPPYATTPFGASVNLTVGSLTQTQMLFAEDHGRAVVSVAPENLSRVEGLARSVGLQTSSIGKVGGPGESIEIQTNDGTITLDSVMVRQIYLDAIPRLMQSPVDPQTTA